MTGCYRCDSDDHLPRDCPHRPGAPIPPAQVPADPQLARTWAQVIRDTLGWGPPEERTRD